MGCKDGLAVDPAARTLPVRSVAFLPDGNPGSVDQSVRVWRNVYLDHPSWVVREDGWIVSGVERLVWVPSTVCNVLLRAILLIFCRASFRVDCNWYLHAHPVRRCDAISII